MGITKRGWAFLGLAGLLYLASMQTTTGLLFLVLGILFASYALNHFASWRCVRQLDVTAPARMKGREGSSVEGRWVIGNPTSGALGLAEVRSRWGELVRVGLLAPGSRRAVRPKLALARRGVFPYSQLRLCSTFPFGLCRAERRLSLQGEIVVYPAVYPCAPPLASGYEPMLGGRFAGPNRSAMGDRFHGVRPMIEGDPVKLIHWPSSSKGLGTMVKEFEEELSGRVSLLVDCTARGVPGGDRAVDWAARAAGSLALAALDEGHHVELVELGRLSSQRFSPFADPDSVLEFLARIEERPTPPTPDSVAQAAECLPRKSSLCFVLTEQHPAVVEFLHESPLCERRAVSVYLPAFDSAPEHVGHARVEFYGPDRILDSCPGIDR